LLAKYSYLVITTKWLSLSPLSKVNPISDISIIFNLPLCNVSKIFGRYVYHMNALGIMLTFSFNFNNAHTISKEY
jgi:hypothetical protein